MNQSTITNQNLPCLPSPYKIIKRIGSGSFGNVYLVINTEKNQQCVVKQLHPLSNQPNFIKQARRLFRQEAEILKKLTHPQIPQLINYFEEEEEFYLVEEYIEGHTLRQELKPNQPWTEDKVIQLLHQGLSILHDIHAQGVIHRDVKPDNFIRRKRDNKLVLIDFGAVKEFNLEQSRLIDPTVAMGTRGYMPTEQARGKPKKNSDIYALGIIAIQALTGINPINLEEDEEGEIIWQNKTDTNPQLASIINKMTRYHHKQRYQSAQEVINALNHYQSPQNSHSDINNTSIPSTIATPTDIPNHDNSSTLNNSNENDSSDNTPKITVREWLKSPLGSTITTAATIGLIATIGTYYLNYKTAQDKEAEKQAFIDDLQKQYDTNNYTSCFELIEETIKEDSEVLTEKAKQYVGKCRLADAQRKAQVNNYQEALEVASLIPREDVYYNQAQIMIENWSKQVYERAKRLYTEEGNLDKAVQEIETIPHNSVREIALVKLRSWREEHERNSYYRTQGERDLEYENCVEAINTAKKIQGSNYWLLEGKKIVDKAKKCLEEKGIILDRRPIPPGGGNYDGGIDLCENGSILCPNN